MRKFLYGTLIAVLALFANAGRAEVDALGSLCENARKIHRPCSNLNCLQATPAILDEVIQCLSPEIPDWVKQCREALNPYNTSVENWNTSVSELVEGVGLSPDDIAARIHIEETIREFKAQSKGTETSRDWRDWVDTYPFDRDVRGICDDREPNMRADDVTAESLPKAEVLRRWAAHNNGLAAFANANHRRIAEALMAPTDENRDFNETMELRKRKQAELEDIVVRIVDYDKQVSLLETEMGITPESPLFETIVLRAGGISFLLGNDLRTWSESKIKWAINEKFGGAGKRRIENDLQDHINVAAESLRDIERYRLRLMTELARRRGDNVLSIGDRK